MRLHEYQAKKLLALHQIPVPRGVLAASPAEAQTAARELGFPVALKAQVLAGGRGRAGGIRLAHDSSQVATAASEILASRFSGLQPSHILVEEAVAVHQELYLGFTIDRRRAEVAIISSATGGVNVEELTQHGREAISQIAPDPFLGLRPYHARDLAAGIGLPQELRASFSDLARNLYECALSCDASLAEINPLAITEQGKLMALDAKIILDDNALYRHPEMAALQDSTDGKPQEREARDHGLNYIKLQGEIGCMVNGAGLAMATMDLIRHFGGAAANFLDIGGGASAERVATALRIILSDSDVRAVLINIFGGITRCDQVAQGLLSALEVVCQVPIVVRLVGTNAEEAQRLLSQIAIITAHSLSEAAQKAVQAANPARGGAA